MGNDECYSGDRVKPDIKHLLQDVDALIDLLYSMRKPQSQREVEHMLSGKSHPDLENPLEGRIRFVERLGGGGGSKYLIDITDAEHKVRNRFRVNFSPNADNNVIKPTGISYYRSYKKGQNSPGVALERDQTPFYLLARVADLPMDFIDFRAVTNHFLKEFQKIPEFLEHDHTPVRTCSETWLETSLVYPINQRAGANTKRTAILPCVIMIMDEHTHLDLEYSIGTF